MDIIPFDLMISILCATRCTSPHCCQFSHSDICHGNSGSIISTVFIHSTTCTLVLPIPCLQRCRCPTVVSSLVSSRSFDTNSYINPGHVAENPFLIACNHVFLFLNNYDFNIILVEGCKSKTATELTTRYDIVYNRLTKAGIVVVIQKIDNGVSKKLIESI